MSMYLMGALDGGKIYQEMRHQPSEASPLLHMAWISICIRAKAEDGTFDQSQIFKVEQNRLR